MENEERFSQQLEEFLGNSGWHVDRFPAARSPVLHCEDPDVDLIASHGAHRYAVQIKCAKEARRTLLEGLLASALLRARVGAVAVDAKPLAVVCAPTISDPLVTELGKFVARFGEGAAWGAMDDSGLVILQGSGLDALKRQRRHVRKSSAVAQRSDFLSDLGQWMLKVVLSHRMPPALRAKGPLDDASIDEPVANATALARAAAVSVSGASRFVASLKEEHFLVEDGVLRFVRVEELLDQWRAVLKRRAPEIRASWLFPSKDSVNQLDNLLRKHPQKPGERACLGLFAACDRLGFRFVSGVAPHIYLEKVSIDVLQRLGLRLAEPGESADVMVREPRFPESVFRGALGRKGIPVTDVLQCWLDVKNHPARGEEMAAHLLDRVIRPALLQDDE
jgi:hypothetical protein